MEPPGAFKITFEFRAAGGGVRETEGVRREGGEGRTDERGGGESGEQGERKEAEGRREEGEGRTEEGGCRREEGGGICGAYIE